MEVDSDIDSQLLQQFSSMGTTDKEVLIAEFQRLLGDQLNAAGCAFFLDMNNWNLQAAICSYYDFEQPNGRVPCMSLVRDITIGEGESVPPSTNFTKTWRIQNSGEEGWAPGCCLRFISGDQLGSKERVMVEALQPGQEVDVSVDMNSPNQTGMYQGQWRMSTATGMYFGEIIWVILQVEENGLLGVTQQMSQFGGEFIHTSPQRPVSNPFASPSKPDQSEPRAATDSAQLSTLCLPPGGGATMLCSPTGSVRAQHGSLPSSPVTPGLAEPTDTHTAEHARTVLFQDGCPSVPGVTRLPDALQSAPSEQHHNPQGYPNIDSQALGLSAVDCESVGAVTPSCDMTDMS